jgi:hypothetical protein
MVAVEGILGAGVQGDPREHPILPHDRQREGRGDKGGGRRLAEEPPLLLVQQIAFVIGQTSPE